MKQTHTGRRDRHDERGVALIVTLLLVSLTVAMGLIMYLSVSSDMLINGFYRNFRGAFYAADSGLNIARAELVNQVTAVVPNTFATPPITNPDAVATAIANFITTQYGGFTSLNASKAAAAWTENFKITATSFALAPGSPTVTSRDGMNNPTGYSYIFNYAITSMGNAQGSEQSTVSEKGSITFNITGATATTSVNFAAFGGFVDQYPQCLGPLVPGTMTGPMFTNGAWEFMTGGAYIFTDTVGQADANADYWFNWQCNPSPTTSMTKNGQTIAPTFQGGYNLGQPKLPLPPNDFSQKRAVLDGLGVNVASPTNAEMNAGLKNIAGTPYPLAGAASGVFMPYIVSGGANVMTGGGIYVEGNASVTLTPVGASAQVYTIGNAGVTTTITVDPLATPPVTWGCPLGTIGTTTVVSGGTTTNICSVTKNNSNNQAATMLYVDGAITALKGPGQGLGAIQDGAQITVAAKGDITATGDILYKTEPVTTTQNQNVPGTNPPCCAGTDVATLIPGHDTGQVLGIYTATGNFCLNTTQAGANIQIDGSIATLSQGGTGGFLNTGPPINVFDNVGGQLQNSIYGAWINVQNIYFDRRFTNKPGFAPPFFPSTTMTQGGALATNVIATVQRVQWLNQTTVQ